MKYLVLLIILVSLLYFSFNNKEHFQSSLYTKFENIVHLPNFESSSGTIDECQKTCDDDDGCVGFSYHTEYKQCKLFNDEKFILDEVKNNDKWEIHVKDQTLINKINDKINPPGTYKQFNNMFHYPNFKMFSGTIDECKRECDKTDGCFGFSYNTEYNQSKLLNNETFVLDKIGNNDKWQIYINEATGAKTITDIENKIKEEAAAAEAANALLATVSKPLVEKPTMPPTKATTKATTMPPTIASTMAPTIASTMAPTMASTMAPTMASTMAPTMASTMAPTMATTMAPQKSYTTNINIGEKTLKLNNIKSINNKIKYSNSPIPIKCSSQSDCSEFKYGKCIENDLYGGTGGECWNILNKEIYEFNGVDSYIELLDVNNLDLILTFVLMFEEIPKSDTIIVYSGIDVWSINVITNQENNNKFIIKLNDNEIHFDNIILSKNTLYSFDLQITSNYIKCTITTGSNDKETQTINFIGEKYNIYQCNSNNSPKNSFKSCKDRNIIGDYNRYDFKLAPIYFGGINNAEINTTLANSYNFFNGYIGGFEFHTKFTEDKCGYKISDDINLIKKQCLDDCIKTDECNKKICDIKCKDIKECHFNSKISQSRHAIDCNNKCIVPENKCSPQYCHKQCYNCGDECYWIKEKSYLEDDTYLKTGRPYPPYIYHPYISYDGTKATFKWKPSKKGMGGETLGYVALLYKTYEPNKSLKIEWINVNRCNRYCKYVINNLDPEKAYTIGIKAYNVSGTGMTSNLINFKTNKTVINTDILNNIKSPTNTEIGNFKSCPKN